MTTGLLSVGVIMVLCLILERICLLDTLIAIAVGDGVADELDMTIGKGRSL